MDHEVKTYDLDNEEDVEILHQALRDLSELDDSSDDDENLVQNKSNARRTRVGAAVLKGHETIYEDLLDLHSKLDDDVDIEIDVTENDVAEEKEQEGEEEEEEEEDDDDDDDDDVLSEYFRRIKNLKHFNVNWSDATSQPSTANDASQSDDTEAEDSDAETLSPLEYFTRYIPHQLFESAAYFTNLYAVQNNSKFKPTTPEELKKLFGLHILMGNLDFPRIHLYWSTTLKLSIFAETMARDRFFKLRTHLHFIDNSSTTSATDPNDRFRKVRPLFESIRSRCLQFPVEKEVCIDEQMVPFRGKFNMIQYVKGKPNPWGIKIFFLCGKSGYPYDFIIYQGENTEIRSDVKKNLGVAAGIVYTLADRRLNSSKKHELYYDNYFSNYHLLRLLKIKNIDAAGTIRPNRFFNPLLTVDKTFSKKPRGTSEEIMNETEDVRIVKWCDNRCVILASNFIGIGEEDTVKRWDKKNKKFILIKRPEVIRRYNACMGGVDLLDQMISLYRIFIRSRKWTLRMIFHAVELAAFCAWKEYQKSANEAGIPSKKQDDLLNFRMKLVDQLISSVEPKKKRGRPTHESSNSSQPPKKKMSERLPYEEVVRDGVGHFPVHDKAKLPTRCKKQGCNEKSNIMCTKCQVHFCINRQRNCFFDIHKPAPSA